MDYMLNAFKGTAPVDKMDLTTPIQLPFLWFAIVGVCLFLNLDYMLYDLSNNGQQVIIRTGKKQGWFLSKCVWNLAGTVGYFAMIALVVWLFVVLTGGTPSLNNTPEVSLRTFIMVTWNRVELMPMEGVLVGLISPCLAVAALSMLEMVLCLIVKPVISFLFCMALLVLSVYWNSPMDLGNGAMAMRSALVVDGGHDPAVTIGIAISVIVICVVVGTVVFKHSDILTKED